MSTEKKHVGFKDNDKWDKLAKEELDELDKEIEAEKAESDRKLGISNFKTQQQEKDEAVRSAARLAKDAADKQNEFMEKSKYVFDGDENKSVIITHESIGIEKRVVSIKNASKCSYTLHSSLNGMVKVFIESCSDTRVYLECKLVTSHVEISHCEQVELVVKETVHTVQADLSDGVTVKYLPKTFVATDSTPTLGTVDVTQVKNPRVIHSGVKNMMVQCVGEDVATIELSTTADYIADGAVANGAITAEEVQFVTQLIKGKLLTERTIRVGQMLTTEREMAELGISNATVDPKKILMFECEKHKEEGNEAFKAREYTQAVVFYTQAIDKAVDLLGPDGLPLALRHMSYCNRAACYLKLGHLEKALDDANACLALCPTFSKALFRKGMALHALKRYEEALPVLEQCLKTEPNNAQVKQAVKFCEVNLQKKYSMQHAM